MRSDGEILVGVTTWGAVTSTPDRLLALTPGGALDSSGFANGGNTAAQIDLNALAVADGDKIVVAGWGILNDDDAFALQRLNADGTPDASFAGGAPVLTRPVNSYLRSPTRPPSRRTASSSSPATHTTTAPAPSTSRSPATRWTRTRSSIRAPPAQQPRQCHSRPTHWPCPA